MKNEERGLYDHGVTLDAKDFIAAAEAEYRASSDYLHAVPGGAGLPESYDRIDAATGTVEHVTRVAAPVGETYVPSSAERFAQRGTVGELTYQRETTPKYVLDERAQLNVKKERQLEEVLASPMPALDKANEVHQLLCDFYTNKLSLQPRRAESVAQLYSQVSLQLRVAGLREGTSSPSAAIESSALHSQLETRRRTPSTPHGRASLQPHPTGMSDAPSSSSPGSTGEEVLYSSMDDVPWLGALRQLYSHQKQCFVAPTALFLEHIMLTVSAVQVANRAAFQLATRLFLDSDQYEVLPTRTTYAAYFSICHVNDAMPFAVARMRDAVVHLCIPPDAGMATALLKGLNELGYIDESVALLARLSEVPMTTALLNVSLEAFVLSAQPEACFSLYESVKPARLKLNSETYTLLLLACEQSGQWSRVTPILADMQRRRVKGTAQTLNLLLKGLLKEQLNAYARQLYRTMQEKQVTVWPALETGVRLQVLKEGGPSPSGRQRTTQPSRSSHGVR